jgi:ABC-type glycerol-3-phosphate transport system substrate-binding protein
MSPASGVFEDGLGGSVSRRSILKGGLAGGALLTLGSVLAACGSSSSGSGGGSTASGKGSENASIKVLNWHSQDPTMSYGKSLTDSKNTFEQANAAIKVALDGEPFGTYLASTTAACVAHKSADIQMFQPTGQFSSIWDCASTITAAEQKANFAGLQYFDQASDPANGRTWGVPVGLQGYGLYYNKALFTRAGLDPENPPTTWAAFSSACAALKSAGIAPMEVGAADGGQLSWLWNLFASQFISDPAQITDEYTGKTKMDDPRIAASLDLLRQTFTNGWWAPGYADRSINTNGVTNFANGKSAICCGLLTAAANWQVWDTQMGKDAYGVMAMPQVPGTGSTSATMTAGAALAATISNDTKYRSADLAFLSYITSKAAQTINLTEGGFLPNRSDVDYSLANSPGASKVGQLLAGPTVDLALGWQSTAVADEMVKSLPGAITGNSTTAFLANLTKLQQG